MPKTPEPGSNLDASTFNLDAWIDDVERPRLTVTLYPYEATFEARVDQIEKQLARAERIKPEERGLDDPSPEQLLAMMDEVIAERDAKALRVTVQQPTDVEIAEALIAADRSGAPEDEKYVWGIAAACVEPKFTGEQLVRLMKRDRSGEGMVIQLHVAVEQLMGGLPVPSSPAR